MKEMVKKGIGSGITWIGLWIVYGKNTDRSYILGDLNGWIGDRPRDGITGAFGIPGANDNERRVVKFYRERGLRVSNTCFKHISFHKYTREARGQDGMEKKRNK